ncbi:MAG: response regulator transcription factor [Armatimonadota bacterium]|nr:response regulator transcription factor [bacterium]
MSHILIADDDADLVEGLRWYLEAEGFKVTSANNGKSALEAFRTEKPDVVILDIMMPEMDGVEACRAIRAESDAYVMMLSARDGEIDKVRALTTGADDYVTKPFHATEVVARIQALLRRTRRAEQPRPNYKWNTLEVFVDERRVSVSGAPIELTAMEFDLLAAFMRRPHYVFTREKLVEIIWNDEFYGELRLVDNHVYRLREKLTAAGLENCPIATVRGVGYAFRPED